MGTKARLDKESSKNRHPRRDEVESGDFSAFAARGPRLAAGDLKWGAAFPDKMVWKPVRSAPSQTLPSFNLTAPTDGLGDGKWMKWGHLI